MLRIKNGKQKLLLALLFGVLVCLMYVFRLPCLFQALLGVPCPGCGMTRAWLAVLRLDLAAAFAFHPLFWSVPVLGAYLLFDGRLFRNRWLNRTVLTALVAGFLVLWLCRVLPIL